MIGKFFLAFNTQRSAFGFADSEGYHGATKLRVVKGY